LLIVDLWVVGCLPSTVTNFTIKQRENEYWEFNSSIGNLFSSYLLLNSLLFIKTGLFIYLYLKLM
jgi:hypothetical protein